MATKTKAPAAPAVTKNAPAIKPDKLPVDVGGGNIQFLKRGDYAKRTAENFAILTKADIKRDHVTQALDAIDSGQRELTGENPEPMVKMFEAVLLDYDAGIEEVVRLQTEEANKKAEEENKKKEKEEGEQNLFVSVKDTKASFSDIAANFDTGNMDRFVANPDATAEDLFAALNSSFAMGEFTSWMQGDIIVALQDRGMDNVVSKVAKEKGIAISGLYNKAKTCRAIPPEKRNGVSYTICSEIATAKFSKEQEPKKLALLDKALSGKVNTQEARKEVRAIQGKVDAGAVLPEENDKAHFLILDPNTDDISKAVSTCVGFPKELFENGAIIVNPKTMLAFAKNGFRKGADKRWEPLPVYVKPEEKAAKKK